MIFIAIAFVCVNTAADVVSNGYYYHKPSTIFEEETKPAFFFTKTKGNSEYFARKHISIIENFLDIVLIK